MSERLTPGQLRDLADAFDTLCDLLERVKTSRREDFSELTSGLRKEANAREAETKPVCVGHTGFCPICHAKPAPDAREVVCAGGPYCGRTDCERCHNPKPEPDVEKPTREDWALIVRRADEVGGPQGDRLREAARSLADGRDVIVKNDAMRLNIESVLKHAERSHEERDAALARVRELEEQVREARGYIEHIADPRCDTFVHCGCVHFGEMRAFLARTAKEGGGAC